MFGKIFKSDNNNCQHRKLPVVSDITEQSLYMTVAIWVMRTCKPLATKEVKRESLLSQ